MKARWIPATIVAVGLASSATSQSDSSEFDFSIELGDQFGQSIANVGDLNADGIDEVAVSNPSCYDPRGCPRIWVFSGSDGSVMFAWDPGSGRSENSSTRRSDEEGFGACVARAGDVDRDGTCDVLAYSGAAEASVYSGHDGHVIRSVRAPTWQGWTMRMSRSISTAGDVDGDGHSDFVVANSVHSGRDGSVLHLMEVPEPDARFSMTVADIGDIDSDGIDEIAIGSPDADPPYVAVVSGRTGCKLQVLRGISHQISVVRSITNQPSEIAIEDWFENGFGRSLSSAGDLDCDGVNDLLVGTMSFYDFSRASIFSGKTGDLIMTWSGKETTSCPVFGVGDLDGDGSSECIMNHSGGFASISARSGRDGRLLFSNELSAPLDFGSWGRAWSADSAGDIDHDGVCDVIISVLQDESPGLPGYATVLSGKDGHRIRTYDTPSSLRKIGARR